MADAIYEIIAAGVPYRNLEIEIDGIDVAGFNLVFGQTAKLSDAAASEFARRCHFDISAEPGPAARLAVALSLRGLRVGVIDLGSRPVLLQSPEHACVATVPQFGENDQLGSTANACRFQFKDRNGATAAAIHYGAVDARAARQATVLVRASKILCLEDRLWDVEGGAEFVAAAIDVALSAGRKIMLICEDPDCVFRNRASIRNLTDSRVHYVVGEATTAQLLYGLERTDLLVQKVRALSMGAMLWRHNLAPLILDGNTIGPAAANEMIDAVAFWNTFLPARLDVLARTGTVLNTTEKHRIARVHVP